MTVKELIARLSAINEDKVVKIKGLTDIPEYWDGEIIDSPHHPEITIVGNGV